MKANHEVDLVNRLWAPFIETIRSGGPVYFTFTQDLVSECIDIDEQLGISPIEIISEASDSFHIISKGNLFLNDDVFDRNSDNLSSVVILICLQILVVEEMRKDGDFTENAYFPRLRKAISSDLDIISQNPYRFSDFHSIWKCFESEIYQLGGCSTSITFKFGEYSGIDKARNFPLSQALFSKEDVIKLLDETSKSYIIESDDEGLFLYIEENAYKISKRGQNLLTYPLMKERLINQVRSFIDLSSYYKTYYRTSIEEKPCAGDFRVRLFHSDLWSEKLDLCVFDNGTGKRIVDGAILAELIFEKVLSNTPVFLVQNEQGDCWELSPSYIKISENDTVVAIWCDASENSVHEVITKYSKNQVGLDDFQTFDHYPSLKYKSLTCLNDQSGSAVIYRGKFVDRQKVAKKQCKYEWVGGISIDRNNNCFDHRYLPDGLIVNGEEANLDRQIKVNNIVTTYHQFKLEVVSLNHNQLYRIELQDGLSVSIKVAVPKDFEPEAAFMLKENRISPICEFSNGGSGVPGFDLINSSLIDLYTNSELYSYLLSLRNSTNGDISELKNDEIKIVSSNRLNSVQKEYFSAIISKK